MAHKKSRYRLSKEARMVQRKHAPPPAMDTLRLSPGDLETMQRDFSGRLVFRGDPEYEVSRKGHNPAFDEQPQLVAFCHTPADVRLCLRWAHEHGWWVTCRSGGHSPAGFSVNSGVVIDVSRLADVHVDPVAKQAWVGAGTSFGKLDAVLDGYGLHVPGGDCESVCVGGYMQGGGYSITSRAYGMNCDGVLSALVMLADGRLVEANPGKNADLFWALRGGTGNNFGVLLRVTYQLHELRQTWAFGIRWNLADAPAALLEMQDQYMTSGASDSLGYLVFLASPKGDSALFMRGLYNGSDTNGKRALASLIDSKGAHLEIDSIGSYQQLNKWILEEPAIFVGPDAEDKQSGYIARPLTLHDWKNVVDYFATSPNRYSVAVIEPYGGAINRVPIGATAFVHRNPIMDFFVDVFWDAAYPRDEAVAWLNGYMELMKPHFNGEVYQNYPRRALTAQDFRRMYWGSAFDDLLWVKKKYDPKNFFHHEQSIAPYHGSTWPTASARFGNASIVSEPY